MCAVVTLSCQQPRHPLANGSRGLGNARQGGEVDPVRRCRALAVTRAERRPGWGSSRGGSATEGPAAPTSIPAACRLTAARGGGARLLLVASGHGRCRHHRGHCPRQWARQRRRCRTLPHGIRSTPVPTGVAPGSRDHPHQRAHPTRASTASHGPLPPPAHATACAPVPCRGTAAQWPNHPHKG
jgi:hypothetical protein